MKTRSTTTIRDKNDALRSKAWSKAHKLGPLLMMCFDLGAQDDVDEERMDTVYPYAQSWVNIASMED